MILFEKICVTKSTLMNLSVFSTVFVEKSENSKLKSNNKLKEHNLNYRSPTSTIIEKSVGTI